MTNQERFVEVFGVDAWRQMIVFSGLAEQSKEFWTSQYENDCRNCVNWNDCERGEKGHENGTSIGYSVGDCKDFMEVMTE